MAVTKNDIVNRISELLIEHFHIFINAGKTISEFQKIVRNGIIQRVGNNMPRSDAERLVLYRSSIKANEEDINLINYIYNAYFELSDYPIEQITIETQSGEDEVNSLFALSIGGDIIDFSAGDISNVSFQDNVSQFVEFYESPTPSIDPEKAANVLDITINELYF
jgi:hypothetical protein|tara:strand:- start:4191 stop:4685 length:495 start_codon:yes stop_codon:yes gene_type:complete